MNIIARLPTVLDPVDKVYKTKKNLRLAAVLIPIFLDGERVLFTKRPEHMKHHQGQIAFPGGKFEDGDENLQSTALRETYEEVGIVPSKVEIVGRLNPSSTISHHYVHPYVGIISENVPITIDPNEVAEYFYVPLSKLVDKKTVKKGFFSGGIRSYYSVDQYKIWGITAGILSDLVARLKSVKT